MLCCSCSFSLSTLLRLFDEHKRRASTANKKSAHFLVNSLGIHAHLELHFDSRVKFLLNDTSFERGKSISTSVLPRAADCLKTRAKNCLFYQEIEFRADFDFDSMFTANFIFSSWHAALTWLISDIASNRVAWRLPDHSVRLAHPAKIYWWSSFSRPTRAPPWISLNKQTAQPRKNLFDRIIDEDIPAPSVIEICTICYNFPSSTRAVWSAAKA